MASMSASGKRGYDITPNERVAVNYTAQALVRGDVVQFDSQQTHGSTTGFAKARDNSSKVNVILPETAMIRHGVFAVVLENIPATLGAEGKIAVSGDALPINVSSAGSAGEPLVPINGADNADPNVGVPAGEKVIGILLEDAGAAGVFSCDFDGLNGFGNLSG